jgi:hypothetical protein
MEFFRLLDRIVESVHTINARKEKAHIVMDTERMSAEEHFISRLENFGRKLNDGLVRCEELGSAANKRNTIVGRRSVNDKHMNLSTLLEKMGIFVNRKALLISFNNTAIGFNVVGTEVDDDVALGLLACGGKALGKVLVANSGERHLGIE